MDINAMVVRTNLSIDKSVDDSVTFLTLFDNKEIKLPLNPHFNSTEDMGAVLHGSVGELKFHINGESENYWEFKKAYRIPSKYLNNESLEDGNISYLELSTEEMIQYICTQDKDRRENE